MTAGQPAQCVLRTEPVYSAAEGGFTASRAAAARSPPPAALAPLHHFKPVLVHYPLRPLLLLLPAAERQPGGRLVFGHVVVAAAAVVVAAQLGAVKVHLRGERSGLTPQVQLVTRLQCLGIYGFCSFRRTCWPLCRRPASQLVAARAKRQGLTRCCSCQVAGALSTRLSPRDSPLGACWPLRRRPAPRRAPVAPPAAWSRPAGTGCAARSASSPPVGLKCVQCRCEQQRGHPLQALVVQLNQRRRHLHGNMHRYLRRDVKGRPPKQTDRSAAVTASCAAAAAPFAAAAK